MVELAAASHLERFWIGLHDWHEEASCDETGFIWWDGTPTDFESWAEGEPNDWVQRGWRGGAANCEGRGDGSGEDCVEVYVSEGRWNDISCEAQRAFVCGTC